jgi:radical SAM superfamily enzyme YgiQ (UPF0313 family)
MILIHPPQVRNCEPPVALAHLAGALIEAGEPVTIIDGALEGYLWLTHQPAGDTSDLQAKRVRRNESTILNFHEKFASIDKYKKKISDIKLLASTALPVMDSGSKVSPADYQDPQLSPLKSSDLIFCWNHPEENLYFPWFTSRLKDLLEKKDQKHVGISIGFLSQALTGLAICGWIKKEYPEIKIILGGSLINSWIKGPSNMEFLHRLADKVHHGEGEQEIVQFTGRSYKGPGIPSYCDLYNPGDSYDYLSPGRILPYSAALGCSWKRCTFCSETWEQNPHCEQSPSIVIEHLRKLSELYKPSLIHLCDSEISPELIDELIKSPPGPDWYGFSRFLPVLTDIDYCRKLSLSGCKMLCLGLESGDQNVLNKLRKGIRLDIVSQVLSNLKEAGILSYVYIMFGTPAEDRDAAFRTRDFILEHSDSISFLNASIFNMPIGSVESEELNSMDFYEGDLAIYRNFVHPEGWNRLEIRKFLDRDFRKIPAIGEILKRTPPVFTSSHAPFMSFLFDK